LGFRPVAAPQIWSPKPGQRVRVRWIVVHWSSRLGLCGWVGTPPT
jgi:hypothetical protein